MPVPDVTIPGSELRSGALELFVRVAWRLRENSAAHANIGRQKSQMLEKKWPHLGGRGRAFAEQARGWGAECLLRTAPDLGSDRPAASLVTNL